MREIDRILFISGFGYDEGHYFRGPDPIDDGRNMIKKKCYDPRPEERENPIRRDWHQRDKRRSRKGI